MWRGEVVAGRAARCRLRRVRVDAAPAPAPPRARAETPRRSTCCAPKAGLFDEHGRRRAPPRRAGSPRRSRAARRSHDGRRRRCAWRALTGRITPAAETPRRREWADAQRTLATLTGVRRTELGYVVQLDPHARRPARADRRPASSRRSSSCARTRASGRAPRCPASGWRTSFGRDPAIFQYYPGRGLQLQPLASWGRANAIAGACLAALRSRTSKDRCRTAALTRSLDRLPSLGARRCGYLAWEYYFAYGSGAPPWVSGMTQATAVQALSRGYRALGVKRWRRAVERALGAFEQRPPSGVARVRAGRAATTSCTRSRPTTTCSTAACRP